MEIPYTNGGDVPVVRFEFEDGQVCKGDAHYSDISLLVWKCVYY